MGDEARISMEAAESHKDQPLDAGATFVLESKGTWLHAGYHLTTAIVGPAILSLPFAFAKLGWEFGIVALTLGAIVTFYGYNLISVLLEQAEHRGQRHLRLRDLASDILGPRWSSYAVLPSQLVISFGVVVGSNLLCGQGMLVSLTSPSYSDTLMPLQPPENLPKCCDRWGAETLQLHHLQRLHYDRHLPASILPLVALHQLVLGVTVYGLQYRRGCSLHLRSLPGHSERAPPKVYSVVGSTSAKVFHSFNALAIIASTYGVSIIPEIQATIASPVAGKMFKGLLLCYSVVATTFFSVSISGYWAFGNQATGNLFDNLIPDDKTTLSPDWLLFLIILFIVIQLLAIAVVYSQPLFDVFEAKLSDVNKPVFSLRNLLPRIAVRSFYIAFAALLAAMLPFFGDLNAFIGAVGFLPLGFILPPVLYNVKCRPSPRTPVFWINNTIIVIYTSMSVLGSISSIRQIALDAHTFKLFSNNTS